MNGSGQPHEERLCARCGAPLGRDLGGAACLACLMEDVLPTAEGLASGTPFPALEPGDGLVQRFGPYELLEEIGRGGMGVIFRARQPGLDRIVAVKMLLAGEFADARTRERLLREARLAARLTHPGIVTIHEVGEHEGRPYFAMEHVPGPNLAQFCRAGLLPLTTAARYVEQIARAVHFAHQHGVVHRDLKSANVLIGPDDQPKLTDFGLTKSLVDPTQSVESAGSPNFMAPEQADSRLGSTGIATDVFGLGAILYDLVTGRPPSVGESLSETLRSVIACEPVAPARLRPALPRDLETITLKCLEREPSRRYGSALEVADELARWRRHEPILARPATVAERSLAWCRRRPVVAALSATVAFAVLAGVASTAWQWRRAVAERREAALQTYVASLQRAEQHLRQGAISLARDLLLAQPEVHRGWEWGRLMALAHDQLMSVPMRLARLPLPWEVRIAPDGDAFAVLHGGVVEVRSALVGDLLATLGATNEPVADACFTTDGRGLITAGPGPFVRLWSMPGAREVRALPQTLPPTSPGFEPGPARVLAHPDGRRFLACDRGPGIQLRRLDTGALEREYELPEPVPAWFHPARLNADGSRVTRSGERWTAVWETESGKLLGLCPPPGTPAKAVHLNPEATHYATVDTAGVAALWRVGEDAPYFRTPPDPPTVDERGILAALPVPEHGRLVTVREVGSVRFWDTGTGKLVQQSTVPVRGWQRQAGGPLVTVGESGNARVWDMRTGLVVRTLPLDRVPFGGQLAVDAGSRTAVAVGWQVDGSFRAQSWPLSGRDFRRSPHEGIWRSAVSPDGTRIASAHLDGQISVWDARTGERSRVLRGHLRWVGDVVWSSDGGRLFSGSADHTVRAWNPRTGEEVWSTSVGSPVRAVAASGPAGWVAACADSDTAVFLDADTGRVRDARYFEPPVPAGALSFSPDGRWLAAADGGSRGGVWEVRTGRRVHAFVPPGTAGSDDVPEVCAFSPDGGRLAVSSRAGVLQLLASGTWQPLGRSTGAVRASLLRFAPGGDRLLLGSESARGTPGDITAIDLHDAHSGRFLARLAATDGLCQSLDATTNDLRLVRTVVDDGIQPVGIESLEVFPWWEAAYAGEAGETLGDRIGSWARRRRSGQRDEPIRGTPLPPVEPWVPPRSAWPERAPDTPPACVDLTSHYNGRLDLCAFANDAWSLEHMSFANLPTGVVELDGISWDIRGLVTTGRRETWGTWRHWPAGPTVEGIPVHRRARVLHVLHAAWYHAPDALWGRYRLHYGDGTTAELEVRAWYDIAFWTWSASFAPDHPARVAWEGTFGERTPRWGRPRLYHRAYENPHPDRIIRQIDLIGGDSTAVPFVVAITLE